MDTKDNLKELHKPNTGSLNHRDMVGGLWDEVGKLQFDFLLQQGLQPNMKLLDVGCGCLRGGLHFIRYLNAGNYYGIDSNESLINAGYEIELGLTNLKEKMPRANLLVNEQFQAGLLGVAFDFAIAQSVFTHLPMNIIKCCFTELAKCMKPGGKFYATFFEATPEEDIDNAIMHQPGGIITYPNQDPYHYRVQDFLKTIEELPWELFPYGDWQHPRGQKMLEFVRR